MKAWSDERVSQGERGERERKSMGIIEGYAPPQNFPFLTQELKLLRVSLPRGTECTANYSRQSLALLLESMHHCLFIGAYSLVGMIRVAALMNISILLQVGK